MVSVTRRTRLTINKSGRITLPARIRKNWGVGPGDYVEYSVGDNGQVRISPVLDDEEIERSNEAKSPAIDQSNK